MLSFSCAGRENGISHMTLNLNIEKLARPGRVRTPLVVTSVRELSEADFELLAAGERGITASPIKRITDRHHSLARLLAAGTSDLEAAAITGYTPARVTILKQSPAFQDLLALYRKDVDRIFVGVLENMAGLSRDALMELRDRLEEDPKKFSNRELLRVLTDMTDRTDPGEGAEKLPTQIELIAQEFPADSDEDSQKGESSEPTLEDKKDKEILETGAVLKLAVVVTPDG